MTQGLRVFCTDVEADHVARRTALSRAADLEPFLRRMRRIKLDALAQRLSCEIVLRLEAES